jgi:DNA polymerase III delta subunit
MVAANQALLKIDLMASDSTVIDLNFLKKVFSKDVDFEASNLVDYSIEGNIIKIQTCINFLKQNDYPAQYVIWSFIRSFRTILFNLDSINNGKPIDEILRTIWPYERKNLMSNSLKKLSALKIEAYLGVLVRLDMQSKNVIDGNTWDSIYDLSVSVAKNKLSVIKYT